MKVDWNLITATKIRSGATQIRLGATKIRSGARKKRSWLLPQKYQVLQKYDIGDLFLNGCHFVTISFYGKFPPPLKSW